MAFVWRGLRLRAAAAPRTCLAPPRMPLLRASPLGAPAGARTLSSAAPVGGSGAPRWRGPVTWISASVTIAGLYGLYQYQYQRQLSRQRSVGKPDLGGPWDLLDPDGKP